MQDAHGHLHDALGRFARTGAMKVTRDRSHKLGKSATSVRKHITESQALDRYVEITNSVLLTKAAFREHSRGERVKEPWRIFYPGHYHGNVTKNDFDAVVDSAWHARRKWKPSLRHTTKRTTSGKAYVVRGGGVFFDAQGREHFHKPKNPRHNLAGKKPETPKRIIDIRTPGKRGRHAKTAREMMRGT